MQNLIFKGLNGQFKIVAATQYITRIKDSTNKGIMVIKRILDETHKPLYIFQQHVMCTLVEMIPEAKTNPALVLYRQTRLIFGEK